MESKQLNRKLSSLFWYILYSFPLLVFLIVMVSNVLLKLESNNLLESTLSASNSVFSSFTISWLIDSFKRIFEIIGISDISSISSTFIIMVLVWFVQMMLIHVIVDCLTFIFNLFHKLMERVF